MWFHHGKSGWTQENLFSYPKVYWLLHKDKQPILVRKRWADTDLDFFPGSSILVHWVTYRLRSLLQRTLQKMGFVNFCHLTSLWLVFNYMSLRYHFSPSTPKRHELSPHFCLVSVGGTSASAHNAHVQKVSNLQVFFLIIFNYHKCFGLAFWILFALSIYLFIQIQFSMRRSIMSQLIICLYKVKWFQVFLSQHNWPSSTTC